MTRWHCEELDGGYMVQAATDGVTLAYLIRKDEWRDAHDRVWMLESVLRSLARNIERVEGMR